MLSRVLGLVRDMVFAHVIPGGPLGAFLFAFSLPNMLPKRSWPKLIINQARRADVERIGSIHPAIRADSYHRRFSGCMNEILQTFLRNQW